MRKLICFLRFKVASIRSRMRVWLCGSSIALDPPKQNSDPTSMLKSWELPQDKESIPEELELSESDFLDEKPSQMSEQVYQMRCGLKLQKIPACSLEESLR